MLGVGSPAGSSSVHVSRQCSSIVLLATSCLLAKGLYKVDDSVGLMAAVYIQDHANDFQKDHEILKILVTPPH